MELRSRKLKITLKDSFADVTIARTIPTTVDIKDGVENKLLKTEKTETSESDEESRSPKRVKRESSRQRKPIRILPKEDPRSDSSDDYDDSKPLFKKRSKSATPVKKRKKSKKTRTSLPSLPKVKEFNPRNHIENFPELPEFYESLRPTYTDEIEQPAEITSILYPYQRRAVSWMLQRETQLEHSIKGENDDFCRGGILADEMGLGKTVELLSLIVSNPMTHDRNNLFTESTTSHHCEEDSTIPIKATLIIMPSTLIFQWKTEIQKHAPSLKVKEYNGIQSIPNYEKLKTKKQFKRIFGDSDIVITSYEVLRTEVNYVDDHPMHLRIREDTIIKPKTPLVKMRWWRVCLDEAQMTKASTTATARMALNLHTIYRWCISGTPVQNGIKDLKGLLLFLKSGSYWNMATTELIAFLKRIMWRHARDHVKNEIEIPSPTDTTLPLELSLTEQFCWRYMQDSSEIDSKISMAKFFSLPYPVMNDVLKKKKLKLSECDLTLTFTSLIEKCRTEYWNSQLELCNSLNDIAAVYYDENSEIAADYYKNALSLEFQKESDYYDIYGKTEIESEVVIRPTNSMAWQTAILRTLLNYSSLCNDSEEVQRMEDKINNSKVAALAPATFAFEKSFEKFKRVKQQVNTMLKNESRSPFGDNFYVRALDYFAEKKRDNFILKTLRKGHMQKVSSGNIEYQEMLIIKEATSLDDLKLYIKEGLKDIEDMRKSVIRNLKIPLCTKFEDIEEFRTEHMKAEEDIRDYKKRIIIDELDKNVKNTDVRRRKLSLVERVLLFLEHELIGEYNVLMKEIEKEDFTNRKTFDRVGLILEEIDYRMNIFNVQAKEINEIMHTWSSREKYLDVLIQLAVNCSRIITDDTKEILQDQLVKKQDYCKIKRKELEFIIIESKKDLPSICRYGTKLEKVTRDILNVTVKEPGTKMLVFSQWNEALSQLAKLLQENNIRFVSAKSVPEVPSHGSVSDRIKSFKENPDIVVCLLNTAKQATGLTLTQANHVFIMDVVDNANDLQAIGRIHRIGQDKPTFVHRYVFAEETKTNTTSATPEDDKQEEYSTTP